MDYGKELPLFELENGEMIFKGFADIEKAVDKGKLHKEKVNVKDKRGGYQAYRWKGQGQQPQGQGGKGGKGGQGQEEDTGPEPQGKVGESLTFNGKSVTITAVGKHGVTARDAEGMSYQIDHNKLAEMKSADHGKKTAETNQKKQAMAQPKAVEPKASNAGAEKAGTTAAGAAKATAASAATGEKKPEEENPLNETEQGEHEFLTKNKKNLNEEGVKRLEELEGKKSGPGEKSDWEKMKGMKHLLNDNGLKRFEELDKKHNTSRAGEDKLAEIDKKIEEMQAALKKIASGKHVMGYADKIGTKPKDEKEANKQRAQKLREKEAEANKQKGVDEAFKNNTELTTKAKGKKGKAAGERSTEESFKRNTELVTGKKKEDRKESKATPEKPIKAKEGDVKDFYPGGKMSSDKYHAIAKNYPDCTPEESKKMIEVLKHGIDQYQEAYVERGKAGDKLDDEKFKTKNAALGAEEGKRRAFIKRAESYQEGSKEQRQAYRIALNIQERIGR